MTELQHYWKDSVRDAKQHEATDVGRLLKSVDDDGNTPLHLACKHGFLDVAKTLIKMPGANIGARWASSMQACPYDTVEPLYKLKEDTVVTLNTFMILDPRYVQN